MLRIIPNVQVTSNNVLETLLPVNSTLVLVAAGDISVTGCHVLISIKDINDNTIDAEHLRTAGIIHTDYQQGGKPVVWTGRIEIGNSTIRKVNCQFSGIGSNETLFMTVGYEVK